MSATDLLPSSAAPPPPTPKPSPAARYKFYALAAIILLAFWSMLTGTVTLNFSAARLDPLSPDLLSFSSSSSSSSAAADLDVLEMEEREKVVRHMWDVYTNGRRVRLPRFWQEAFEAGYEELADDDPEVRDAAVAEVARMSTRMLDLDPLSQRHKDAEAELNQKNRGVRVEGKLVTFSSAESR